MKETSNVWERIKVRLQQDLASESYQSWFARTSYHGESSDELVVAVPDSHTKEWIEKEFGDRVLSAARALSLPYSKIRYAVSNAQANGNGHSDNGNAAPTQAPDQLFEEATSRLNARYTFDGFVVGSCNQFAHAAAKAVTEQPARSYNPLFIYGGVGMGKTHLVHAIGHALLSRYPETRVVSTTGERFMNQLITCIRTDRMSLFHQYYRSADVLLVDDVHMVAGKERTQEEFFHTFNELYDHQKQIVLSSDTPPSKTNGLVDRLRSRFEWGLLVDVQPPDLETKLAILDKKAEAERINLPSDVRLFIAMKTKSNVRELEGALIRLLAFSSVTSSPITIDMARQTLKHLSPSEGKRISFDMIQKVVCEKFTLTPTQLRQKSNQKQISYPRQIGMYVAKEVTAHSLPEIGRAFGGKHHTTVLHALQKIERERQTNPETNRLIQSIIDSLY